MFIYATLNVPSMRGQVTVFVIAAILLIAFGLYQYNLQTEDLQLSEGPQSFLASCIDQEVKDAAITIAKNGGYLHPDGYPQYGEPGDGDNFKARYFIDDAQLPYLFDGTNTYLRSLDRLSRYMANYVALNVEQCYSLEPYANEGWTIDIDPDTPLVTLEIGNEVILANVEKSVKMQRGDEEIIFNEVPVKVPNRLGKLHGIASQILNNLQGERYVLSQHCDLADDKINIYKSENKYKKDYAVRIVDSTFMPLQDPLKFQFAIKNIIVEGQCVG